jgi:hypothetical protein
MNRRNTGKRTGRPNKTTETPKVCRFFLLCLAGNYPLGKTRGQLPQSRFNPHKARNVGQVKKNYLGGKAKIHGVAAIHSLCATGHFSALLYPARVPLHALLSLF